MEGKTYTLRIRRIYPGSGNGTFEADLIFVGDRPSNIKRGRPSPEALPQR